MIAWSLATFNRTEDEEAKQKIRKKMRKEFTDFDAKLRDYYKGFKSALEHNLAWSEIAIGCNRVYFSKNQDGDDFIAPIRKIQDGAGKSQWHLIYEIYYRRTGDGETVMKINAIPIYPDGFKDLLEAEKKIPSKKLGEWQDQF